MYLGFVLWGAHVKELLNGVVLVIFVLCDTGFVNELPH